MKKQSDRKRTGFFTFVTVLALLSVICGVAASAAYIHLNMVKRVVSTQGAGGIPFSSNYLLLVPREASVYAVKTINCPEGASTAEFEINVCNYVQNDPSRISEKDITYTLTFTQLNNDGTANTESFAGLKVKDKNGTVYSFANGVCSITDQLLTGNSKSVNTYYITVPKQMVDNAELRAVAEPSDSSSYSAANGSKLGRLFAFSEYNASSTTWTGSFLETTSENYDAFNYVIRGQGKGTVTISWDPSQLEISRIFLENYSLTDRITSVGSKNSLTIDVDSSAGQNRYDIQFYKTENGVYTNMGTINGYVTVDFTESLS